MEDEEDVGFRIEVWFPIPVQQIQSAQLRALSANEDTSASAVFEG